MADKKLFDKMHQNILVSYKIFFSLEAGCSPKKMQRYFVTNDKYQQIQEQIKDMEVVDMALTTVASCWFFCVVTVLMMQG